MLAFLPPAPIQPPAGCRVPWRYRVSHRLRPRAPAHHLPPTHPTPTAAQSQPQSQPQSPRNPSPPDVILVGGGLSNLCTAALLAAHGRKPLLLESHAVVGGAAHTFHRTCPDGRLTFESGPHLFSGLTYPSANPFQHVLQACDLTPPMLTYPAWGMHLGSDYTRTQVPSPVLMGELLSPQARAQITSLTQALRPLGEAAATALPPALIRLDASQIRLLLPRLPRILHHLPYLPALSQPFAPLLERHVTDPRARALVQLLCFLLAGVDAHAIPLAEVAFMFRDWGTAPLQRPVGGAHALAQQLVQFVQSRGGEVRVRAHVERVLVEGGRAVGVRMRGGGVIRAPAVVAGVSVLDAPTLLGDVATRRPNAARATCDSFMHVHVAVRRELVHPADAELLPNYAVVKDILQPADARDNVVLISIPSAIDASVAPEGWVVAHAYTPATEPWAEWADLTEGTRAYEERKQQRAKPVWEALDRVLGCDIRKVGHVCLTGSPRTHARFLRRAQGSYGARVDASLPRFGLEFANEDGIAGLFRVGDGVFPGPGVPAVAASAWVVANSLVGVREQRELACRLGL